MKMNSSAFGPGASLPTRNETPGTGGTEGFKQINNKPDFRTQAVTVKRALMRFLAADRTFFCGVVLLNLLSGAHAAAAVIALSWLCVEVLA